MNGPQTDFDKAIALAQFASENCPRKMIAGILERARNVQAGEPGATEDLQSHISELGGLFIAAGSIGVRIGDPSASALLAAASLGQPPEFVLTRVLAHVNRMVEHHRAKTGQDLTQLLETHSVGLTGQGSSQ